MSNYSGWNFRKPLHDTKIESETLFSASTPLVILIVQFFSLFRARNKNGGQSGNKPSGNNEVRQEAKTIGRVAGCHPTNEPKRDRSRHDLSHQHKRNAKLQEIKELQNMLKMFNNCSSYAV